MTKKSEIASRKVFACRETIIFGKISPLILNYIEDLIVGGVTIANGLWMDLACPAHIQCTHSIF